ncbi:MAG: MATE family efflux transporter [Lachnospiraceae bacterium]|nr:MATE family efflux transporter [Lachnospiraceae bacterium]
MQNLTEGSIFKVLMKLSLPIMASAFLATAYSITDLAWIGTLGSSAVAGVGVGGMYVWLSQGLSTLARMGGQVPMAQELGKGNLEQAKKYAVTSLWVVTFFGILFGIISLLFADPMVAFFDLDTPQTITHAKLYLQITCGLILFSYVGYTLTGLYTAQGDSKTPLKANFIGLLTNMILDPVLILGIGPFPRLEVVGAAIATVFAQFLVALVLIFDIYRPDSKNILKTVNVFQFPGNEYFKSVFRIGTPAALQGTLYCAFSMVLTRMVSGFGDGAIATQRVGGQIESITWNVADGFAAALNAFSAQNFGAGKMDRVKKGYYLSAAAIAVWGSLIGVIFVLFPEGIANIFFHEPEVVAIAIGYLLIIAIGEPFMCVEIVSSSAISGLGNTKLCSIISIIFTGSRIPLAYLLSQTPLELEGIWWALTITSMCKGILFILAFQKESKKRALAS